MTWLGLTDLNHVLDQQSALRSAEEERLVQPGPAPEQDLVQVPRPEVPDQIVQDLGQWQSGPESPDLPVPPAARLWVKAGTARVRGPHTIRTASRPRYHFQTRAPQGPDRPAQFDLHNYAP